jgi:hypothetical protein
MVALPPVLIKNLSPMKIHGYADEGLDTEVK